MEVLQRLQSTVSEGRAPSRVHGRYSGEGSFIAGCNPQYISSGQVQVHSDWTPLQGYSRGTMVSLKSSVDVGLECLEAFLLGRILLQLLKAYIADFCNNSLKNHVQRRVMLLSLSPTSCHGFTNSAIIHATTTRLKQVFQVVER